MKCLVCQTDNKEGVKSCRKCGVDLNLSPLWRPNWKWHLKVLGGIYVVLIIAYFAITAFLDHLPKPYRMREIPPDVTPWLKK
jgi:antibiotic biosynthesis monooxygenase (ABM) superfamily enzyme